MKLMISGWICHSEGCLSFILGNRSSLSCHCSNPTIRWPACDLRLQKCIPGGNFRSFGLWEMNCITWGLRTISIIMDSPSLLPICFAPQQSHVFFMEYGYHVKKKESFELNIFHFQSQDWCCGLSLMAFFLLFSCVQKPGQSREDGC